MKGIILIACLLLFFIDLHSQKAAVDTVFRFNDDSLKCKFSFTPNDTKIFDRSSTAAFYPGGLERWNDFLKQNLHKVGTVESTDNTTWIRFIVRKNGELSDFNVLQSHNQEQEEAALLVLKKSQHWLPATFNGFCVNAFAKIAIEFK